MQDDEYEDQVNQLNQQQQDWMGGNPEPHGLSMFDMLTDEEGDQSQKKMKFAKF
jgi:hypothetical protein